ncbi:hypothetical protein [Modicisalibacter luteus]|uniref:Secreted protein n=1 Tax=Modicisalibacter luteus TaxID=453962 RepID=A0ABV7LY26_9GAMM|nr:hypothetical protein [Halomonas lutea]GHB01123.1 hypothetical protein GCM10007159_23620 [Halomonas lutea]
MKWTFASAGVLSAVMLALSYTTDVVPEPPDTVEIEPEQVQGEIEEVAEEANEAVDKMMPGAVAKEGGIGSLN